LTAGNKACRRTIVRFFNIYQSLWHGSRPTLIFANLLLSNSKHASLHNLILTASGSGLILGSKTKQHMKSPHIFKKAIQYFLQGLIILAPIAITIYAVTALFNFVDNILPSLIGYFSPDLLGTDANGNPKKIPGLGFILVTLIVILVGYISSSFIVSKLVDLFDKILERTPGIKLLYSTVKDFFEAFAGNKRKFDKSVLVSIETKDVWQIGFITQEDLHEFGLEEYVAVYVPQSYAFTGRLYFVKPDRVRLIADISSAEAMKFAISGGVTNIEEDTHQQVKKN
jgi:uncharacterized membrane protein